MSEENPKQEEIVKIDYAPPREGWLETKPDFRKGTWCYGAIPSALSYLDLPNPRKWQPSDDD